MSRIMWNITVYMLLLSLCHTPTAMAGNNSWSPIGPYGGTIRSIAVSPDYAKDQTVMAGIWDGLFVTVDNGLHWQTVQGMEYLSIHKVVFSPDYATDRTIFVGGHLGLFRSTDAGATWAKIVIASPPAPDQNITALAVSPAYPAKPVILAGTDYGALFRSDDNGTTWKPVTIDTGLTNIVAIAFASSDVAFLLPGNGLLQKSSDAGNSWSKTTHGSYDNRDVLPDPDYTNTQKLLVATATGARISTDSGSTWAPIIDLGSNVLSLAASPDAKANQVMYAGTSSGAYRSSNGGNTWQLIRTGTTSKVAAVSDSTILAAILSDMMLSNDSGATWNWRSQGILGIGVRRVIPSTTFASDGIIYVASMNGGVFRSSDRGTTWNRISSGFSEVRSLAVASTAGNNHTLLAGTETEAIFKSNDSGQNWTAYNEGIDITGPTPTVFDLALSPAYPADGIQLCSILSQGVRVRNAAGIWTKPAGLPANLLSETFVYSIAFSPAFTVDQTVFAGHFGASDQGGVSRSSDGGMNWSPSNKGLANSYNVFPSINIIAPSPAFATDQTVLVGTDTSGAFRSSDGGSTWTPFNTGLEGLQVPDIRAVAFSPAYAGDRTIFLADLYQNVFRNDGGSGWSILGPGISGYPRSLAVSPDFSSDHTLFAGTSRGVHAYTIDDQSAPLSAITNPIAGAQLSAPQILIQGTASDDSGMGVAQVEISTDNGATWEKTVNNGGLRHFASWSYTFTPPGPGTYQLLSRATDRLGQTETPAPPTDITIYTYPLTITSEPTEGGTLLVSPASSSGYYAGSSVSLTAMPASGYVFTGWSGDAGGTANPLQLTMNSGQTVTANFAKEGLFITATQKGTAVTCRAELFNAGIPLSAKKINFYSRTYSATDGQWSNSWTSRGSATTTNGVVTKTITLPLGRHQLKAVSVAGEAQLFADLWIGKPQLLSPESGNINIDPTPTVSWATLPGATGYLLQNCPRNSFAAGSYQETTYGAESTGGQLPTQIRGVKQYWRVVGLMPYGYSIPATPRTVIYKEGTTLSSLTAGVSGSTVQPSVMLTGNDSSGGVVAGKIVSFFHRKAPATKWSSTGNALTGADGIARLAKEKQLPPGSYDIRALFKGDNDYSASGEALLNGVFIP